MAWYWWVLLYIIPPLITYLIDRIDRSNKTQNIFNFIFPSIVCWSISIFILIIYAVFGWPGTQKLSMIMLGLSNMVAFSGLVHTIYMIKFKKIPGISIKL